MDIAKESPTVLSFCTGYGGIELGLERVFGAISPLAHVEIEAYAIANLVAKMEAGQMVPAPVWTDVKTFPAHLFRGRVDILTGGYPCQPFSSAGRRGGDDDPRHLWPHIRDHIRVMEPVWCFFENVEGHITLGLSGVISDLEQMGYLATWGLFSAAEAGAPHQRKRVFILAYRNSEHLQRVGSLCYPQGWQKQDGQVGLCGRTRGELGNTRSAEQYGVSDSEERDCERAVGDSGEELGNASVIRQCECCEITGAGGGDTQREKSGVCEPERAGSLSRYEPLTLWPARPGQRQHCWEEPRTVGDTRLFGQTESEQQTAGVEQSGHRTGNTTEQGFPHGRSPEASEDESELGRAAHGASCGVDAVAGRVAVEAIENRIDRLRACGNGVLPKTAATAWCELIKRFI